MSLHTLLDRDDVARRLAFIARDAGDLLVSWRPETGRVETKPDGSPVSGADRASEALILAGLAKAFPGIPVVSEENVESHGALVAAQFFLVDPLDGTKAYLAGEPDFCVLIALIRDGAPVAAAIDAPVPGVTYWVGESAFRSKNRAALIEEATRLEASRIGGRIAVISRHHAGDESRKLCTDLGATLIRHENSALKFIRLVEGAADFYPRPGRTMQWDVAAGDALLGALGGGVRTRDHKPLRYGFGELGWANPGFIAYRTLP